MIQAHRLADASVFLGQTCALCKQEFVIGDEIVVCPEDGSRHHAACWQANGNRCTAYGCTGAGEIGATTRPRRSPVRERTAGQPRVITQESERPRGRPAPARPVLGTAGSKVRTLPAGSFGCARGCLIAAVILVAVLLVMACFGLLAVADYLRLNLSLLPHQPPLDVGAVIASLLAI